MTDNVFLNLRISGVTSQINVDNTSDDDVIEVVRDEAPIEILSDDEEAERNKTGHLQCSVIQNFHFTSIPDSSDNPEDKNSFISNLVDPLNSTPQNNTEDNKSEVEKDAEFILAPDVHNFNDQESGTNDVNVNSENSVDNTEKSAQDDTATQTVNDLETLAVADNTIVKENKINNDIEEKNVPIDNPDNSKINDNNT